MLSSSLGLIGTAVVLVITGLALLRAAFDGALRVRIQPSTVVVMEPAGSTDKD